MGGRASASRLALFGGDPAVTLKPQPWPVAGDREVRWMEEVVRSGNWSWVGEHEQAFCDEFARFVGARHAICLANGTVTIQCALQAVGVRPGDEVIVPGLTWTSTAHAPLDVGADVILVDIDPETWCIDPAAVEAAVTDKTRAIVPVHLYGCMADMDALCDIARRHNLKIVEDVAHQHGSRWRDRGAGSIGDAGSFSFQQSKVLTSGEGGAVTTSDDAVRDTVFALKHAGWTPPPDMRPARIYGRNYRITEMQCVLLRCGLSRLKEQTEIRDANAKHLAAGLARIGGPLRAAERDPRVTRQAYYGMTLHFDPKQADGVSRGDYLTALAAEGMPMSGTYEPVYRHPLLNLADSTSPLPYRAVPPRQDYASLSLPVTERVANETGVVLMHFHLLAEPAYIDQLIEAVDKVNGSLAEVRGASLDRVG